MFLTRLPCAILPKQHVAFDLHVLRTPPAFVLSQDQTLHLLYCLPYRALLPQRGFHSLALAPHCFALHPLKEQIPHRPTTAARRTSQRIPASAGSVLRQAFFLSSLFYRILFFSNCFARRHNPVSSERRTPPPRPRRNASCMPPHA